MYNSRAYTINQRIQEFYLEMILYPRVIDIFHTVYNRASSDGNNILIGVWMGFD